jgi:hypothetical protein
MMFRKLFALSFPDPPHYTIAHRLSQAFGNGTAKESPNWYQSQVTSLRKDFNDKYEALVSFGCSKKETVPHEEWIPQDIWRIDKILNRSV